jgi:hypothetical protein
MRERGWQILLVDHTAPKAVLGVERVWIFWRNEPPDYATAPVRPDHEIGVEPSLGGVGGCKVILRANADHRMVGSEPDTGGSEGDSAKPSVHGFPARALSACGDHRQGWMFAISKCGSADDARKLMAINAEACSLSELGAAFEYRHTEAFMGQADCRR